MSSLAVSPEMAEVLRLATDAKGITRHRAAAMVGISPIHFNNILVARSRPSKVVAERIATVLDLPPFGRELLLEESSTAGRYMNAGTKPKPKLLGSRGRPKFEDSVTIPPSTQQQRTIDLASRVAEAAASALSRRAQNASSTDEADRLKAMIRSGQRDLVYICRIKGCVMIGHSLTPRKRVRSFDGELLCLFDGGHEYEKALHVEYAEYARPDMGTFDAKGRLAEFIIEHLGEGLDDAD